MADNFIKDDINIDIQEAQIELEVGIDSIDISVVANTIPPITIPDAFTSRSESIDGENMYRGDAETGSLEADSVWQMKKFITLKNGSNSILYADGTGTFNKVWNDRATYTYL